jgi:hypothetical protein
VTHVRNQRSLSLNLYWKISSVVMRLLQFVLLRFQLVFLVMIGIEYVTPKSSIGLVNLSVYMMSLQVVNAYLSERRRSRSRDRDRERERERHRK